jgi:hypothetical protein
MAGEFMDIITPQLLYHGTTANYITSFRNKLLDCRFWRPGRDFGEGLYTTVSIDQACKWARKAEKSSLESDAHACVLVIELISIPVKFESRIFLAESLAWAEFIFMHRNVKKKGLDPCKKHPDIIIGPMADSDTGKIVKEAVQLKKDVHWFYDQITRTTKGKRLDSLRLGNQVVFSSERLDSSLRLLGYYIYEGGRWIYHENASKAESL